jgi:hypothetical protein
MCARARRLAAPLLAAGAICLGGCGGGGEGPTTEALTLRREDLVAVSRALSLASAEVALEVADTKRAWPLVVDGLPRVISPATAAAVAAAAASAARLTEPAPIAEPQSLTLTGPGSQVTGLFHYYVLLSSRGWRQIAAAVGEAQSGSPAAARFARENVALYIESVYDAHFALAQIGKKLKDGYHALAHYGDLGALPPATQVQALEDTYSEANDRLQPHVGVRLGS